MSESVKEQRVRTILEAGYTLFAQNGYQKISMADIARATGMGRTTLYDYFGSKQDILFALLDEVISRQIRPDGNASPVEQLSQVAVGSLERLQKHEALYRILFQELPALDSQVREQVLRWQALTLGEANGAIRRGLAEGRFSNELQGDDILFAFTALLSGKMNALLFHPRAFDAREEAKQVMHLFLHGTAVREVTQ